MLTRRVEEGLSWEVPLGPGASEGSVHPHRCVPHSRALEASRPYPAGDRVPRLSCFSPARPPLQGTQVLSGGSGDGEEP